MGFLDCLWDETLAGPAPDEAAGRLRKYNSLSALQMQKILSACPTGNDVPTPISHRITVLKQNLEPPSSPTGSESPHCPVTRTPRTRKIMEAYEKTEHTGYDWIVISSLDH